MVFSASPGKLDQRDYFCDFILRRHKYIIVDLHLRGLGFYVSETSEDRSVVARVFSNNAKGLARKCQVSIFKSLVSLDQGSNSQISQNGRWTLYSFGHPV